MTIIDLPGFRVWESDSKLREYVGISEQDKTFVIQLILDCVVTSGLYNPVQSSQQCLV
jgi:hypothetical protein